MSFPPMPEILWGISDLTTTSMVQQALDAGADPNLEEPKSGVSPLKMLMDNGGLDRPRSLEIFDILLRHGANPLAGDCAFLSAFAGDERTVLPAFIDACIKNDYRSESGETIFHIAAQSAQETAHIGWTYSMLEKAEQAGRIDLVSVADNEGNTPLHTLWSEDSYAMGWAFHPIKSEREQDPGVVEKHWDMTRLLIEAGNDVLAKNKKGKTALSVIKKQVKRGFSTPEEGEENHGVYASLQAQWMENDTPKPARTRTGRRI